MLDALLPANRFYASKFAAAGLSRPDMQTLADLHRLPFTTKEELLTDQERHPPYGSALTYPVEEYCRLHQTSGTQGVPLRWLDTPQSWARLKECWAQIFAIVGLVRRTGSTLLPIFLWAFSGVLDGVRGGGGNRLPKARDRRDEQPGTFALAAR